MKILDLWDAVLISSSCLMSSPFHIYWISFILHPSHWFSLGLIPYLPFSLLLTSTMKTNVSGSPYTGKYLSECNTLHGNSHSNL
jgi:hypothetical protein